MMVVGTRSWFRQPSMMSGIEIALRPEYPQPPIWSRDNKVGTKVLMSFSRLIEEVILHESRSTNLKRGER